MSRTAVGQALLEYGRELELSGAAQTGSSFSGNPQADELLKRDANAFLLGVLFTQGIPAERAWQGPWLLLQRLGTIELPYLAENPVAVRDSVQIAPMLHRFKETLPRWIVSAAVKLLEDYQGNAGNIWSPGSTVTEVVARLSDFDGIGRKKAVMAAELLTRHFGVALQGREGGQVAFDVQVRRVFLRAGLAEKDSIAAIEEAARELCPEAPGTLDLAAWLVGRESCRPKAPQCESCRLGASCPRRVWLDPQGVGSRSRPGQ